MSNHGLSNLGKALTGPLGPHLNDETLAELASAEAAGEDIDVSYPAEVAHLESCAQCADSYGELIEMMVSAVGGMAEAASMVKPLDVYVEILLRGTAESLGPQAELTGIIRGIAASLPPLFPSLPTSPSEVSLEAIEAVAKKTAESYDGEAEIVPLLARIIQQNLAVLSLFLRGFADSVWGSSVRVSQVMERAWPALQLKSAPVSVVPTLSDQGADREWQLLSQRIGDPLPLNVTAWAERVSPLACTINVRIDRPGLRDVGGRTVQLQYADQALTAETDSSGIARFESVPIAAVPNTEISFQDE